MSIKRFYCDNLHVSTDLGPCMFCEKMAIWPELMHDLLQAQLYEDFEKGRCTGIGTHEGMDPRALIERLKNGDRSDECRWVVGIHLPDGTAGNMLRVGFDLYPKVRRSEWEDTWNEVLDRLDR